MTKATVLAFFLMNNFVWAGVSELMPNGDMLSPAVVEMILPLQKESSRSVGVQLVQVDNGGSTDLSGAISPSRVYLAFHQDGEMCDVSGSYLVSESMVRVFFAKMIGSRVYLKYTYRDEKLKFHVASYTLFLDEALKEAVAIKEDPEGRESCVLTATVGMQDMRP